MKTTKELFGIFTLTMALAGQIHAQPFLTNGLVAYYLFNGNANDTTGNGNTGTLFGAATFGVDRFGNPNSCLSLPGTDGTGSGVDVPSLDSMPYFPVTYSAWFLISNYPPPSTLSLMNLVGREDCGDQSDGCLCLVTAGPSWGVSNDFHYFCGSVGYPTVMSSPTNLWLSPPTNLWCHVVLAIDENGNGSFYLNGTNVVGFASAPSGQPGDFRIGASAGGGCGYEYVWNGRIDDVRIYNRALTSNEVQQLYAHESAPQSCIPYPATAAATIVDGYVVSASVTDGGCGYTNTPVVLIVGGGGSGATATAVVTNGIVVGISITDAGNGYTSTPTVYIYSPLGVQIGILQAVIPIFSSLSVGSNYQLQASTDLNSWTNQGPSFTATNPSMIYPQYFDVTNWNQFYYRLQVAP